MSCGDRVVVPSALGTAIIVPRPVLAVRRENFSSAPATRESLL